MVFLIIFVCSGVDILSFYSVLGMHMLLIVSRFSSYTVFIYLESVGVPWVLLVLEKVKGDVLTQV